MRGTHILLLSSLILWACDTRLVVGQWTGLVGGSAGVPVGGAAGTGGAEPIGNAGEGGGAGGDFSEPGGGGGVAGDAPVPACFGAPATSGRVQQGVPLPAPWQTGFEQGFCEYQAPTGYCYEGSNAGYRLVSTPTHTGATAMAFELEMAGEEGTHQTRCVRQGTLPDAATYSAWYYVPSGVTAADNWNLFHFRGGMPNGVLRHMWDVNIGVGDAGELALYVADTRTGRYRTHLQDTPVPLPTDRWFLLEFYLKRAADATGEVALFQDGQELLRVSGVSTDDNPFTQWYVGNYANSIQPPRSIVYVDDVSIRLEP